MNTRKEFYSHQQEFEEDFADARHPIDITRGRFVNLNIDLDIHGVGGADTWGKRTLPEYTIDGTKPHSYSFILWADKNKE